MRQGLAGWRVLCPGHQDSASLVRFAFVQLAAGQIVWFSFAHLNVPLLIASIMRLPYFSTAALVMTYSPPCSAP